MADRQAADAIPLWRATALLGEGVLWEPEANAVWWVDIKGTAIRRYGLADGSKKAWWLDEPVGFILPRRTGGYVLGLKSGLRFWDPDGGLGARFVDPEPSLPDNRLNDGMIAPDGSLLCGSMDDLEASASGHLYRVDGSGVVTALDGPYIVTNGPAISADGLTLYHVDTLARRIWAFDRAEDGSLSGKRLFWEMPEAQGYPDGITADADGGLWVAHWAGWRLSRLDPDGAVERTVGLPVERVTKCAFGGENLDRLFVSTASIGMSMSEVEAWPDSGGLFEVDPGGVTGVAPHRFAG